MPELEMSDEDWRRDRRLVISDLRRVSDSLDKLTATVGSELTNMKIEIAVQRTKSTLFAAIASAITSIIFAAIISAVVGYITRR